MNDEDWSRVKELRLLDDIDDARERLTRMRRAFTVGLVLAVGGVALVLGTATAQTLLPLPAAWGFIYILYTAMIVTGGAVTATAWLDELPPARKALKRAERAHRNWTMGESEDWR
jgi:hypothetical protein